MEMEKINIDKAVHELDSKLHGQALTDWLNDLFWEYSAELRHDCIDAIVKYVPSDNVLPILENLDKVFAEKANKFRQHPLYKTLWMGEIVKKGADTLGKVLEDDKKRQR